jgi:hypothetical protein
MSGAEPWTASKIAARSPRFAPGGYAEAADQPGDEVGQDVAKQVHGHDDIEALGGEHQLHAGGIDDHVVVLDVGILGGDLLGDFEEQAVGHLEDVGLVDDGDFLAAKLAGVLEGVADDALGAKAGDDGDGLGGRATGADKVLDAGVDVLGVFAGTVTMSTLE